MSKFQDKTSKTKTSVQSFFSFRDALNLGLLFEHLTAKPCGATGYWCHIGYWVEKALVQISSYPSALSSDIHNFISPYNGGKKYIKIVVVVLFACKIIVLCLSGFC